MMPLSGAIPLLIPDIPSNQDLLPWLNRIQDAKHYSNFGHLVCELESFFAKKFELPRAHVTTVANATLGLELVLQALDLPPGSHILIPAFTFVATATAVLRQGHIPVLADVDEHSWLLTADIARAACRQGRIDMVVPVATFGMPQDMRAWQQFEQETGLPVVVDAAAAYGSQWLDGSDGTLVFSLHATKSLPAVEGGLVVSSRPGLAAKVRQLSNFGINLDASLELPVGMLLDAGTNAKMSELHAAVCLASLQVWEEHSIQRRILQAELMDKLDRVTDYRLAWQCPGSGGVQMAPTLLCAKFPDAASRDAVELVCKEAWVGTRRWYQPLLQDMKVLQQRCKSLETPNAELLSRTLLGLPFFLGMTSLQQQKILGVVAGVFSTSKQRCESIS